MNYRLNKRGTILLTALIAIVLVGGSWGIYTLFKPKSQPTANVTQKADTSPAAMSLKYVTANMATMMVAEDDAMHMTTPPDAKTGDEQRANDILASLHKNLDKYQDIKLALADGYTTQAKSTDKTGQVYHYHTAELKNGQQLDPTKPNALLYQRGTSGKMNFVGVMYVAGSKLGMDQINEKFYPLSQSIWHQHLNTCRTQDQTKKIGVNTKAACDAKGGVFRLASSWMTHLFLFTLEPEPTSTTTTDPNM